ncbi:partner of bursicon-like [Diadema antillarum]|uniref:partner of bursicon-like n=1 Tax=Diadema antillarum TaxID=105358 RepID=UPI003A8ACD4F
MAVERRVAELWLAAMLVLLLVLMCGAGRISKVSSLANGEVCELSHGVTTVDVEVFDETMQRTLRCREQIQVNQCEGRCRSQISPTVLQHGFDKKCRCCREHEMVVRRVVVTNCRDHIRQAKVPGFSHEVTVKEPANCLCQICSF